MVFLGRERELARIEREIKMDRQSAILVYGRRRVGKSELIKQSLPASTGRSIYYECKETSELNNLESLSALVSEVFGLPPLRFDILEALLEHLFASSTDQPLTLVLDKYPYLRKTVTGLDSILQALLDRHRDSSRVTLILCGSFVDPQVFYDRYISRDFEENYVPHAFKVVCRQFLIRKNRLCALPELFDEIGRYWYGDPITKTNGEFDVVTRDPRVYIFYEAKFRSTAITQAMIEDEIGQVRSTGLDCYAYGFFSRSGFDDSIEADERLRLFDIDDLYR